MTSPATNAGRQLAGHRGHIATMLATNNAADKPHKVSSKTCPRFDVVSTEYHEHISAITINGNTTYDVARAVMQPVSRDVWRNISAHCATKHNSATVATERPTTTLDSQVLTTTSRCTSNTGNTERNAQPNT
jgi:hypothetical protein